MPSPASVFAMILFGSIGFGAFLYGKRLQLLPPIVIGVALMVYPYFISDAGPLYLIGAILCGALYYLRER